MATVRPYRRLTRSGFLRTVRWSALDGTFNCHLIIGGNDTVPTANQATTFKLSDIVNHGELVSLFDQYRIVKVIYRWVITRDPSQATLAANKGIHPRINWKHDFNDSTPITVNQMYQNANMREFFFTDNRDATPWYTLNPAMLSVGYETATASSYTSKWRQWLDTNDSATPHYGIKYCTQDLYSGVNLRLEAKIVVECKGVS